MFPRADHGSHERQTACEMSKNKRNKLRVAFRKNRQKRARTNDLTREALDEDLATYDFQSGERLTGKGDLTRYRTVVGVHDDETDELVREIDAEGCLSGRVVSAVGLTSLVQTAGGDRFECTVRRIVRTMSRDARNAVVTGDDVLFRPLDDDHGVIERVNARRGTLSRETQGKEHVIVANVDQVLIVASADDPPLKPNLIDRFILSTEKGGAESIVCINKTDLVDPRSLQRNAGLYARLGYEVVLTSAMQQTGLARLRQLLRDKETVFTGQSGVGKSSLLNAIQPGLALRTSEVSEWTRKGRHTTRRAVLLELDQGGWVVDTPGIRQFELWNVVPEEVEGFFVEFRPFVIRCKFPDCSHTHETHCGVKQAVDDEMISPARYNSYVKILEDEAV